MGIDFHVKQRRGNRTLGKHRILGRSAKHVVRNVDMPTSLRKPLTVGFRWWCDREKGVAGLICSQILPFADPKVLGLWFDVETQVYKALDAAK
jgi:hypothetical protein